jgi:multimeric flavodoxin WrbA
MFYIVEIPARRDLTERSGAMRITILNGEPDATTAFDAYVGDYAARLADNGHDVTRVDLRDLTLKGCSGCWGCWVKTPGTCVKLDDSATVCRAVIGSDLLVLASPMRMGFTSSLLKRAADQMIPLIHPNIVIEGGEMHHRARYAHYPRMGLLIAPGAATDAEDVQITRDMWSRMARNMKSSLAFTTLATTPAKEAADGLAPAA